MRLELSKKIFLSLALGFGLSTCAKTSVEVSYPQLLGPAEAYAELKKLAVGIDPYLAPDLREALLTSLKNCPSFQEIVVLEKPVKVSGTNPKDYLEAFIKTSEIAQSAQGILSLQIEVNTQSASSEKAQVWVIDDKPTFTWSGPISTPFLASLGQPQQPEISHPRRSKRRDTLVRFDKTNFVARFVVYNRVKGTIIHDRVLSNQSTLQNYSRKSGIKKANFLKMVEKSVVDEALFYSCPVRGELTRNLYYGPQPEDATSLMINEGIELAEDDRWTLAASKWTNVLLKDPKQAIAQHNLGVHYEKQGDILKALEHYRLAALSPQAASVGHLVYDELLKSFQPPLGLKSLYPQIAFLSGSGWVYIRAEGANIPATRVFSVYRIEPNLAPDLLENQGVALREIGRVRLQASFDGYFTGRLRDQLVDAPVKAGDFVIID